MSELRVILLLIGAAVLAVIYFFSRPRKPRQAASRQDKPRGASDTGEPEAGEGHEPEQRDWKRLDGDDPPPETLKRELKRLGELIKRDTGPRRSGRRDESEPAKTRREPPAEPARESGPDSDPYPAPDKIVVIYVRAKADQPIGGRQLIEAAEKAGLEYGDMHIYHRLDEAGTRETIFSMANMVAPGTLDQAASPGFTTPGVALFLRLPGPLSALDAWDAMLATGRRLAELLGGELLDETHSTLNRQRIQQLREEMREFDRLSTLEIKRG